MIKKACFFCRVNIYFRKIYILFVAQTFVSEMSKYVSKYVSEMRCILFTFSFIFFSIKKVFFSKKHFHCKTFFPANNVYFVKNTFFFKKKIMFQLSFATNEQPYH